MEYTLYVNLLSLATTAIILSRALWYLIAGISLRRSQNCLEKFQHTNCEKICEPTPTVLRIHAPPSERGFLPLANEDTSPFSSIRTKVKHK